MKKNAMFAIAFAASMACGCVSDPGTATLEAMCKEAGGSFLRTPSLPVSSVAVDWNPANLPNGPFYGEYRITDDGRVLGASGASWSEYRDFDFVERRHSIGHEGLAPGEKRPYVRFVPRGGLASFHAIEELTADVLVFHEVSDPEEMKRAPRMQRMVRYKVTVSDRRTGDSLATMVYWVDMLNQRACRANRPNLISVNAFVRDAVRTNR
jgi:hypothetical protein